MLGKGLKGKETTSWSKRSVEFETILKPFDTIFDSIVNAVDMTKEWSKTHVKRHAAAEKAFLITDGPEELNHTVTSSRRGGNIPMYNTDSVIAATGTKYDYIGHIYEEIDCFTYTAVGQVQEEVGQCRTLFDIYNSTMYYFCKFLVGPMTITWVSMFMIGLALTLYIQIARAVSMYFMRMDEIHPDDITQEDRIKALTGGKGLG